MILFENVSKAYKVHRHWKPVFNNLDFAIRRGDAIGICGANGAGKSTLMRMLAGVEPATGGKITRTMTTSWPIGFTSAFQMGMTGADNARFIARVYNKDEDELLSIVDDFAELGEYLYQPVKTYSTGMQARLAFGVSLTIDFDCYLIDEVTGAGDIRFRTKSENALMERSKRSALVMISHDPGTLQQYCNKGAVLYGGGLTFFDTISEACEVHYGLQTVAR